MILKLDEIDLKEAAHRLAACDDALALVLNKYGYPPLWAREPGFSTLMPHHSGAAGLCASASANAAFQRLKNNLGEVAPDSFLALNDVTLRDIGFSRKTVYARSLARGGFVRRFRPRQARIADRAMRYEMK